MTRAAIGLLSGILLLFGGTIHLFAQAQEKTAPSVVVATVEEKVAEAGRSYVARVSAITTVNLQARVTGFLEKQNFEDGSFVKAGDLLYQIEKAPYQASVAQAKADVEGAEATQKNAELYLERQKVLHKQGDVPQSTVDAAVAALGVDQAATAKAKAELQAAQIDLNYTDIFSPLDGRIGISAIDTGNVVGPDSGVLATINSVDPVHVVFFISEIELLDEQRKGLIAGNTSSLSARITLADGKYYGEVGAVSYVDIVVQQATDTIKLRATFANPDAVLIPGQFVTIQLEDPSAKPIITVPQAALQLDNEGHFVFVVDDKDVAERRDVTLGAQLAGNWIIEKGLKAGEKVIVEGLQKVHEGGKVKPHAVEGQKQG